MVRRWDLDPVHFAEVGKGRKSEVFLNRETLRGRDLFFLANKYNPQNLPLSPIETSGLSAFEESFSSIHRKSFKGNSN